MKILEELLAKVWFERIAFMGLVIVFIYSGIDKLLHFDQAIAEFSSLNMEPAWLLVLLTIGVQLGGSALLFFRRYTVLGALMLAVFTAMATLIAHRFWEAPANNYVPELNAFLEHLGLIGAFVLVAHLSAVRSSRNNVSAS
ncbi:DoxX family protein [Marinomonas lutimaris]|uniref:DoxX family protein n=1 Tax=Marinomonas lutimaris TaxID=2846746 RepID=UPI001C673CFB|nr:DoxX family protein [Marinomonas lutimaris]